MIKAFMFDLGGVLLDKSREIMFKYYQDYLKVNEEDFLRVFLRYKDVWQKGEISESGFWLKMANDLNILPPQCESLWMEGYMRVYKKKEEMFDLVRLLKQQKYKISVLTNTEPPVMNFLKSQKYENFDFIIYSCEMKMIKPDAEIYHHAIGRLKVKPDEIIFIDDKEENVSSARKLGMNGHVFLNSKKLKEELFLLGVL